MIAEFTDSINVRITKDLMEQLNRISLENEQPMSFVVRRLLTKAVTTLNSYNNQSK